LARRLAPISGIALADGIANRTGFNGRAEDHTLRADLDTHFARSEPK
jgi:hypothetical protein